MKAWFSTFPTSGKTVLALGSLLLVLVVCGGLSAGSDVDITFDQAIELARPEIDFDPEVEGARLVRQGFSNLPVWAVVFEIPGSEDFEYEELMMVEIDARTGAVLGTRTKAQLGY